MTNAAHRPRGGRARLLLLALAAWAGPVAGAPPEGAAATATVILSGAGYWRQHATLAPPTVSATAARAAGMKADPAARLLRSVRRRGARLLHVRTAPPPADWTRPDFDDRRWPRTLGRFDGRHEVALLCRRAAFLVPDPSRVRRLTLEVAWSGGLAVHLNGREVLRRSLPPGELTPRTPGGDHPLGAFFVATGERKGQLLHHYTDRALAGQFALRTRSVGPVELPVGRLRRGRNVLAVECHRSGYPAACRKAGPGEFAPVGLARLVLAADAAPGAIVPSVGRPPGFQLFAADVVEDVYDISYGCPADPPAAVRIVAARNGRFSGQIVAGSTGPIRALSVRPPRLARADGEALPASAVGVRYGVPGRRMTRVGGHVYGGPAGPTLGVHFHRFEGLLERPPDVVPVRRQREKLRADRRAALGLPREPVPGAVCPIWLTVHVPADAACGEYAGDMTVAADGVAPHKVPVVVEVADWAVPDPADYASRLSIYQSPDTLAAYYKVTPWSARHWSLIERSVKLIAAAGNHTIILPLLSKEQGGNAEGHVTWLGPPDGPFTYDFSVMERYLDCCLRHHDPDRIAAVCLTVWGNAGVAAGNPFRKEKYDDRGLPLKTRGVLTVTRMDWKTGRKVDMPVPRPGDKAFEAFWRPVLTEARKRLAKRGLADRMLLGMPADPPVPAPVVAAFRNICPDAGWFVGNHPGRRSYHYDRADRRKVVPVRHCERVYTGPIPDPAEKRHFGWRREAMVLAFNRYGFGPLCLYPNPRVWSFRILTEADLAANHRGPGRIGADYWPMGTRSGSGGAGTFYMRYPASSVGQTGMAANCSDLLAPGPDGPVATARFEQLREGTQAAEAVVFIEKALLAAEDAAKRRAAGKAADAAGKEAQAGGKATSRPAATPTPTIDPALAARCWQVIDDRINAIRVVALGLGRREWQARDRRLFQAAAEVAKAIDKGAE